MWTPACFRGKLKNPHVTLFKRYGTGLTQGSIARDGYRGETMLTRTYRKPYTKPITCCVPIQSALGLIENGGSIELMLVEKESKRVHVFVAILHVNGTRRFVHVIIETWMPF